MCRRAFTLVEVLIVIVIIGALMALLIPAVGPTSQGSARSQICLNNLDKLALAIREYADEHRSLPTAHTANDEGETLLSWRALILPYLGERELFESIILTLPWNAPQTLAAWNETAWERGEGWFQCRTAALQPGMTTYLAVVGPRAGITPPSAADYESGSENALEILLIIDAPAEYAVHWMEPTDLCVDDVLAWPDSTDSSHPEFLVAGLGDGRVLSMSLHDLKERLRASRSSTIANQTTP